MPDLPLSFSTAGCWLLLAAMALRGTRPAALAGPATPAPTGPIRADAWLVPVALILHGMLLYRRVIGNEGLDLGVANAVSMLAWLTVLIYWLASLAYTGLAGILGMMAPIAFLAVVLQATIPSSHIVTY